MSIFYHESLERGDDGLAKLADTVVLICGCGALGGNVAENLARAGCSNLAVVDMDRIEERNLSTQPYTTRDVSRKKADVLAANLYHAARCRVQSHGVKLDSRNAAKLLRPADLVIDTFDNSVGRSDVQEACASLGIPCLHAGMAGDYSEVIWDPGYRVPSPSNDDVCDYPLARTLAVMTAAIAAESAIRHIILEENRSYTFTFSDMRVQRYD